MKLNWSRIICCFLVITIAVWILSNCFGCAEANYKTNNNDNYKRTLQGR